MSLGGFGGKVPDGLKAARVQGMRAERFEGEWECEVGWERRFESGDGKI
jgi:hypothetical protein